MYVGPPQSLHSTHGYQAASTSVDCEGGRGRGKEGEREGGRENGERGKEREAERGGGGGEVVENGERGKEREGERGGGGGEGVARKWNTLNILYCLVRSMCVCGGVWVWV